MVKTTDTEAKIKDNNPDTKYDSPNFFTWN